MQQMTEQLLTMGEAARQLCISRQTLRHWYRKGLIQLVKFPTGRFRVPVSEVQRLLVARSNPQDEA